MSSCSPLGWAAPGLLARRVRRRLDRPEKLGFSSWIGSLVSFLWDSITDDDGAGVNATATDLGPEMYPDGVTADLGPDMDPNG